ncbi:imidazolonepropionase [Deinobacterium chartae]|uniref:Imidazolonepropionase n=1 Tax=Deinobacterium chartae TaxID=521158 RepID=A0A841I310_9DEIO|nr:imidazolonepropionase [Deinobacterium chartae]MBB6098305.1 imidazolonepropionase [Deinobacterium chartae]
MNAELLLVGISQLATPQGSAPARGNRQSEVRVIEDAALALEGGRVVWAGPRSGWPGSARETRDLGGRAVVPGLVDPHTHAVWAGDRLADFEARARGDGYEAILARGGGIRSTVRATAAASVQELVDLARPRLEALLRSGATTVEVKSGYGLEPEAELRALEAVAALRAHTPLELIPTLLIHVPPAEAQRRARYLEAVCAELVPEVARRGLADAVDVFVEREAFSAAEAERILEAAHRAGLRSKLHADQFHAVGGTELAVRLGSLSVDHLEASGPDQIAALAAGSTVATVLPGVSLHLGLPGAPGRALIDAGAAVAVGSDLNPGSSPLASSALPAALAVRLCGLTPAEALTAATLNAACALGLGDRGRLEAGARADFVVLTARDWRALIYDLSGRSAAEVWISGRCAARNTEGVTL